MCAARKNTHTHTHIHTHIYAHTTDVTGPAACVMPCVRCRRYQQRKRHVLCDDACTFCTCSSITSTRRNFNVCLEGNSPIGTPAGPRAKHSPTRRPSQRRATSRVAHRWPCDDRANCPPTKHVLRPSSDDLRCKTSQHGSRCT